MTTKEAIQAMLDGKKLTSKRWVVGYYIYFDGEGFRDEDNCPITLSDISDVSEHLKVYEEPKTVIMEKWLFRNSIGVIQAFEVSKCTMDTFCDAHGMTKLKLLDTYEITLEG